MRRLVGPLLLLLALAGCTASPQPVARYESPDPLILISIDGFRADYLQRGKTPTIASLAADGAVSEGMRPSFPSLTFPNHYTLVTGLVPDHHGIVANRMVDPAIDTSPFTYTNDKPVQDARWWNQAVPVWVSAERAGLRTATMFWPGSEAPIRGVLPSHTRNYDFKVSSAARVDQILAWLDLPAAERPRFLTLYFDQVDHHGHVHGPDSPELDAALVETDREIARLRDALRTRGLFDRTNLVLVADHGMAPTPVEHWILVERLLLKEWIDVVWSGATLGFNPRPGMDRKVERALKKLPPEMQCWHKENIPARLRFGTNPRIPRFVCLAKPGWVLRTDRDLAAMKQPANGQHGYDPADPLMAALFVARGPAFKPGVVLPPFDNVDVYPLLMRLLQLKPEPNDGTIAPLLPALRNDAAA